MTLREWIPNDYDAEFPAQPVSRLLDFDVIENIGADHPEYHKCPINRKFIFNWCKVTDGKKTYAVAWNENPAIGWSFPIKRIS